VFIFHKSFHKDETFLNVFSNLLRIFLNGKFLLKMWYSSISDKDWDRLDIMEMSPKPWKISCQSHNLLRFNVSLKINSKRLKDTRKLDTLRVLKGKLRSSRRCAETWTRSRSRLPSNALTKLVRSQISILFTTFGKISKLCSFQLWDLSSWMLFIYFFPAYSNLFWIFQECWRIFVLQCFVSFKGVDQNGKTSLQHENRVQEIGHLNTINNF